MILTGPEIRRMMREGKVVIDPFDSDCVEENSYGFHLGDTVLEYTAPVIDTRGVNPHKSTVIGPQGYVLEPGRFYLGHTHERIGGVEYAAELYANLSTALCGIFLQTSAPLGHTGAVIRWTLEIVVALCVRVYPRMKIGKICFRRNFGSIVRYDGRYAASKNAIASRLFMDYQ